MENKIQKLHITLHILLYTDYITILAEIEQDLQIGMHILSDICKGRNITISSQKTKMMAILGNELARTKVTKLR